MAAQGVSDLLLHNFPENGVKFLLHNPGNLEDLLRLLAARHQTLPPPDRFDFARRSIEPDTFIRGDFSHGITDLLVRLPFSTGGEASEWVKVYLLFEHLSAHQRHVVPRSLGYVMDAYRVQERRWLEGHRTLQGLIYEAVVPIVVYTGERAWLAPTPFHELVNGGNALTAFIPPTQPLFLSLPGEPEEELVQQGGAFGMALHVLQRHAETNDFQKTLIKSAEAIERRLSGKKHRLLELLSYLAALVYHFRNEPERSSLRDELERSIQTQSIRKEFHSMGRTIAEALRAEGRIEGKIEGALEAKQQAVVMLLRRKFGRKANAAVMAKVRTTKDLQTLDQWLGNIIDADTVEEVGIE